MLEFKITQELKPNPKLLELIKDFTYKTKKLLLNRSKNRQVSTELVGFIFTENSNTVQKHRDLKHSQKQVL